MTEEIVMTPRKKDDTTIINIEKVERRLLDETQVAHKAGGHNTGLVINKQIDEHASQEASQAHHLQLEFKCFLVDQKSGKHIPELRCLKFWFPDSTEYLDKVTSAYDFFRELVKPENFPRDYVGFIKKIMKGMQQPRYNIIKRIQVDMRHLKENETEGVNLGEPGSEDKRPKELVVQDQILLSLESAFPNVLPTETLLDMLKTDRETLVQQLTLLSSKNLLKELEPGRWLRNVLDNKSELRIVKNLSGQVDGSKPKIAIVTSKYYEKVAVDAMMENKTSYVKFKSEGESNVYTIGYIGTYKVVSTKLPMIGHKREAQISSGNTTTRLLGTFGEIEHVLLVGVCGGVPQCADYFKHVRLGDIIVSAPRDYAGKGGKKTQGESVDEASNNKLDNSFYLYCDKVTTICDDSNSKNNGNSNNNINNNNGTSSADTSPSKQSLSGLENRRFSVKGWSPVDHSLLQLAWQVASGGSNDLVASYKEHSSWHKYLQEGQQQLEGQEVKFSRPPPETDRLFMKLGGADVIEVGHPSRPDDLEQANTSNPTVRFGVIGSGSHVTSDEQTRLDFACKHHCVAFDSEIEQVLESIEGSRKDSYLLIRGVGDYREGERGVEWQPYAALAAAAFMKVLIEALSEQTD